MILSIKALGAYHVSYVATRQKRGSLRANSPEMIATSAALAGCRRAQKVA
jgi:hypothetical protein